MIKIEIEDDLIVAHTCHRVFYLQPTNGCLDEEEGAIGKVYTYQPEQSNTSLVGMMVNYGHFEMTPEDAMTVGHALITMSTIARNKTIIKEPTNDQ